MDPTDAEVLIVGAGPAGLSAAIELRRMGVSGVIVAEREPEAGGAPLHSNHLGFGMRDMHRLYTGPRYAAHLVRQAERAGVDVRTQTMVVDWTDDTTLKLTSPVGHYAIKAQAVLLATGCRERPRAARLVPGYRPYGILTTGSLQRLVRLNHLPVGRRAIVIGAEHVSFSAVTTLTRAGAEVAALITDQPTHQTHWLYKLITGDIRRVPLIIDSRVTSILGKRRVEAVEVTHLLSGRRQQIACDTVVFTGDWVPENELATLGSLAMDQGTRGPQVDQALRSSAPGIFAAGNLLHGAEPADIAALEGRHVAAQIQRFLAHDTWLPENVIRVCPGDPIEWVFPNAISLGHLSAPRNRFVLRVKQFYRSASLQITQGDRALWESPRGQLIPNRSVYLSDRWLSGVDPSAEPVVFTVRS